MRDFNFENLAKNLPDSFAKAIGSNNYKLLEIEKDALNLFMKDVQDVHEILEMEKATGETLDLYGEMVSQPRGEATDPQYILLIKSKIAQNMVTGDYASIIDAICQTFDCKPEEVLITEKPYEIEISALPLDAINEAGMTANQALAIIDRLLPTGVTISSFLFDGTFELAYSYEDMKVDGERKGFTDVYENLKNPDAIGGYLGITMGDENEAVLPL